MLVLLVAVIYWPVWHFGFVEFDDPENLYRQPHVLGGPTAENVRWALTAYHMGHWVPLTRLTYLLDQYWFNLNPGVMHVEDVLLHLTGSLMVYAVLVLMTGAVWRSAAVAILFAVHPMHVESVVWITERRDVLSTPLLLAAVLAYVLYVRSDVSKRKWGWYAAAIAFYGMSLTAKAMGTTLPMLLLLLDFWPLRRMERSTRLQALVIEKVPFAMLALVVAVLAVQAQAAAGAVVSVTAEPVSVRLANAVVTDVLYLGKLAVPTKLSAMYVLPSEPRPVGQVLLAAGLLVALIGYAARWRRRRPYLLVGLGWFLVTLLPVSGIVQSGMQAMGGPVQLCAVDRIFYIGCVGRVRSGYDTPGPPRRSGDGNIGCPCNRGAWW